MCDQDHFDDDKKDYEALGLVTRRQFGVLVGAGISLVLPQVMNAVAVTEADVTVKTPDGEADCYFVHPASGTGAGVLVWPDIFGLRPAFRQMGKRLAESGYSVLVVNPFYRVKKAPTAPNGAATPIADVMPLAKGLNETTHMSDAKAFIGWLDAQASVAKNRKIGTQGYCMGGPIAFRTAAAVSDRVGAVASFHGGGLVDRPTEQPAPAGGEEQGTVPDRDCRHRRSARAERQGRAEGNVRQGEPPGRDRGVRGRGARLVPAGLRRLQRAAGREGVEPSARALRQGARLASGVHAGAQNRGRLAVTVTVIRTLLAVAVLAGAARQQAGPRRNPVVVFETGRVRLRWRSTPFARRPRPPIS